VEKIHHTWSFGSDATVLDDYALTTTMLHEPLHRWLLCLLTDKCNKALKKVRPQLLRCIHLREGLLSELVSNDVITKTMKEEIDVSNAFYAIN